MGAGGYYAVRRCRRLWNRFREDPLLLRRRVHCALEALRSLDGVAADRIAAIGFCFGGMAVLELARSGARLNALSSFHGILTTQVRATRGSVRARVLAATGARDPLVPDEQVQAFQQEMSEACADWHLLVHGQALHSYTNCDVGQLDDPGMVYDPFAHELSWSALVSFLSTSLWPERARQD